MTPRQGLAFVKKHGVVLLAARGPAPSLAEAVAGEPIRGSWWAHAKAHEIFEVGEAVSAHCEVLVCKLLDGKLTYIHRRLWPAFVKLASRFRKAQLAKVWNEHTETGAHRARSTPFPSWVPDDVSLEAARLSLAEAERILAPYLAPVEARRRTSRKSRKSQKKSR